MKIGIVSFVVPQVVGTGTGKMLREVAKHFSTKPDTSVEVLIISNKPHVLQNERNLKYGFFQSLKLKLVGDFSPSIIKYVLENKFDRVVFIGSSNLSFSFLLFALKFTKCKSVMIPQMHDHFIFRGIIARLVFNFKRWLCDFLTFALTKPRVICFSEQEALLIRPFTKNVIVNPLGIMSNTVRLREPPAKRADVPLTLLHIGEITRNKFPSFAIDVLKEISTLTGKKVKLIAVGTIHQNHFRKIHELVNKEGLAESIVFTGTVSQEKLDKFLQKADVFVLFSYSESGPWTVLEALEAGVPVVATRVGMIPYLEKKGCLLAVEFGDAKAMAKKMLKVYTTEPVRASLLRRSAIVLEKELQLSVFLENVYKLVLE